MESHLIQNFFQVNVRSSVGRNISVTLVCVDRFHHFDLTREQVKRGTPERFFTGYPSWKLHGEGIPGEYTETFPYLQTLYMALGKWGFRGMGD